MSDDAPMTKRSRPKLHASLHPAQYSTLDQALHDCAVKCVPLSQVRNLQASAFDGFLAFLRTVPRPQTGALKGPAGRFAHQVRRLKSCPERRPGVMRRGWHPKWSPQTIPEDAVSSAVEGNATGDRPRRPRYSVSAPGQANHSLLCSRLQVGRQSPSLQRFQTHRHPEIALAELLQRPLIEVQLPKLSTLKASWRRSDLPSANAAKAIVCPVRGA